MTLYTCTVHVVLIGCFVTSLVFVFVDFKVKKFEACKQLIFVTL